MNQTPQTSQDIARATLREILQEILPHVACAAEGSVCWVALSGGLDSCVLLDVLAESRDRLGAYGVEVRVVHVNHQLSVNADAWQAHCEGLAAKHGLTFFAKKVSLESSAGGIELAAREARYQVFEDLLGKGDILLMAHHQDDQAETLLFRLVRGAGLKGLAAVKSVRPLGQGILVRPMLATSRSDIETYAVVNGLRWVEDESNQDESFDRNYIRHTIVPSLQQRWPAASKKLAQSCEWLRETDQLLCEYADEDLLACARSQERIGESLLLENFGALSDARKKQVLRRWCEQLALLPPEHQQWGEVEKLIQSRSDACPQVEWGNAELRRFRQRLYLMPRHREIESSYCVAWDGLDTLMLPGGWRLSLNAPQALGLQVKFRQGGERCRPCERRHSQTLKNLLQEYALEPWLRSVVPLIYCNEQLIAVGDLFVCGDSPPPALLNGLRWEYVGIES